MKKVSKEEQEKQAAQAREYKKIALAKIEEYKKAHPEHMGGFVVFPTGIIGLTEPIFISDEVKVL